MADRYWVGGTASWDATALLKWAPTSGGVGGQAVPTASDDVYFDAASGAVTATVAAVSTCRNLTFTGFTGTFAGASNLAVSGSLTLGAGMTISYTGTITFNATTAQTITSNGKALDGPISFDGVGGSWVLQDAFTDGATRTVTLTNGTLDLNSKVLTAGTFASSNTNTRTIAFGTGKFVGLRNGATIWSCATHTGLTITGAPVVEFGYSGATGTRGFSNGGTGGSEATAVTLNVTAGTDIISISNSSFIKELSFTGFSGSLASTSYSIYGGYTWSAGMTVTAGTGVLTFAGTSGTKMLTTNGKTIDVPLTFNGIGSTWAFADALTQGSTRAFTVTNGTVQLKSGATSTVGSFATSTTTRKYLQSTTGGVQATLSDASGTNSVNNLTIQDIAATGGAVWNASAPSNQDAGDNSGWLMPAWSVAAQQASPGIMSFLQTGGIRPFLSIGRI